MPFQSESQRRLFWWKQRRGELPAGTAERWQAHTQKAAKLPERVGEDDTEKKAFVRAFLMKCAAAGVTEPADIAAAAERLAGTTKAAEGGVTGLLGDAVKGVTGIAAGLAPYGPLAGIAAPTIAGFGVGALGGHIHNQINRDDAKVMRLAALANAYKRRTAEANTNAEVRKVVESDPSRYVVLG